MDHIFIRICDLPFENCFVIFLHFEHQILILFFIFQVRIKNKLQIKRDRVKDGRYNFSFVEAAVLIFDCLFGTFGWHQIYMGEVIKLIDIELNEYSWVACRMQKMRKMYNTKIQNIQLKGMSDSKVSEAPSLEVYIRKSDLDDVQAINKLINEDSQNDLNKLYDYPTILNLFEKSYISFTILSADQEIIGAGSFNDFPQGLRGKYDNVHDNMWEDWIDKAFNLEGLLINSYNSLWLTFFHIDPRFSDAIQLISEKLLQSLYVLQPQLEGVLFLKRGEVDAIQEIQDIAKVVKGHFLQFKIKNPQILKGLIGISYKSKVYYSPKSHVNQTMEIRMARQEDHDDLAYIFNKQSEVLTSQFGEFFIADLIAAQNLTRRMNRGDRSEGKAIVGQVGDKAIGLMSISTEIDYGLLNQYFQLDIYEHLIKNDLLEAINNRYEQIRHNDKINKAREEKRIKKLLHQERIKSFKIGQRILLQNYCLERQAIFKNQFNNILKEEPKNQNLTDEGFQKILETCLSEFQLYIPSDIFQKYPEYSKDLETYVMSSSEFFIETLQLFGLPKNYVKREGHWKDWVKSIMQKRMDDQLRRPKNKKTAVTKKKGKDKKQQDNDLKPPSHFDLSPLNDAYLKFISVGAEIRTIFRQQLTEKMKRVIMLFCDQNGQMVNDRVVDMNTLGKVMNDNGIAVSAQVSQNLSSLLEAFGGIGYDEKVVQMQKIEQKKGLIKKQAGTTMIDVTQKLVSYKQFAAALENIRVFDIELTKLGFLKNSPSLDNQVKKLRESEQAAAQKQEKANKKVFDFGQYRDIVKKLKLGELPVIPYQANNAIVINLFCIDEIFQARSLEFVEYAFTLFPDRDYIIITQPFTVAENTLVKSFIQVPHKKNSTFEHCLYIFHKDYLFAKEIKVRRSKLEDIDRAQYLIQQMLNPSEIESTVRSSITETSSMYYTLTVTCGQDLIGLYTISKNVNLDYYVSHFFVQDHIIINEHPRQNHGKVIYSLINPLFIKSVRFILKEIMRLTNKTCLYFEVHNRTLLPDIFNEFTPLRMRIFPHLLKRKWNFQYEKEDLQRRLKNKGGVDMERNPYDQQEAPFSLSMITKRQLNYIKESNNTRIVVVGASDTGISFIESLLTIKNVNFTNIMLLSPGGIVTMHVKNQTDFLKACSTNYTLDEIKNLMLDARTTVVDSKMVKLDKKNKKILIDRNAYIPFDLLILSVGLIDTLLQNQGLISYGLANFPFYKDKQYIKGVYSIDDPYLYQHFNLESENIKLLKRKKKPQSITIYGRTPHTIAFISGIIARGVDPKRIYYVVPGSTRRRSTFFQSNQERIEYDSALINDPDTFEDNNVQKEVINQLRSIGVNVELGFQFNGIDGNPCTGIKFRKKAENYDELDEQIKKKHAEIALKAQEMNNKIQDEFEEDSEDMQQKTSPEKQIQLLRQKQWKQIYTPSSFFITSGLVDIDKQIFNIIHENGLVYNGRLIVKSNFQTTENQIFACGKICEFSQRYKNFAIGKSLRLDRYNGRQLGRILSQHVLQIMNLSYLTTQKYTEDELPKLYIPVGIGSSLFNGMVYYYIKRTQNALPKMVIEKNIRNQEIASKNIKDFKGHYIKFSIDPNGIIQSVSYMGSEGVVVPSLMSFVGMSVTYLNKIMKRNDHGMIPDIAEFLSENWAICLYHELFSEFRHYIKKSLSSSPIAERINNRASEKASDGEYFNHEFMQEIRALIPPEIISEIRAGTISFIQQNRNHLPMYFTPGAAV